MKQNWDNNEVFILFKRLLLSSFTYQSKENLQLRDLDSFPHAYRYYFCQQQPIQCEKWRETEVRPFGREQISTLLTVKNSFHGSGSGRRGEEIAKLAIIEMPTDDAPIKQ